MKGLPKTKRCNSVAVTVSVQCICETVPSGCIYLHQEGFLGKGKDRVLVMGNQAKNEHFRRAHANMQVLVNTITGSPSSQNI